MPAEKVYITDFTVTGSGEFPLDMLRYDSCWPVGTVDAGNLCICPDRSAEDRTSWLTQRTIKMRMIGHTKLGPTLERWRSYGWTVYDVEGVRMW